MNDDILDEPESGKGKKVPPQKWVPERPFDSSEYLQHPALGYDEVPPEVQAQVDEEFGEAPPDDAEPVVEGDPAVAPDDGETEA